MTHYPLICAIFWISLFVIIIMIVSWFLAGFKATRWLERYITLKGLVYHLEVNQENYDTLWNEFTDIDCNTDDERRKYKHLWAEFQYRFKEYSTYSLK